MYVVTPSNQDRAGPAKGFPFAVSDARDDELLLENLRILLVEDEVDSRELLADILEIYGCHLCAVGSAKEGFEALQRFRPHIIVSDISMPEEDGFSFMTRVRALSADEGGRTPSLALTAMTGQREKDRAQAVGFDAHLSKPVLIPAVVQALAALVRGQTRP